MAAVYSRLTEKVHNNDHTNQYKIIPKNRCRCTYAAPICLHEMQKSYITDYKFFTKGHVLPFLKKEIITFKPMSTSSLALFK